MRPDDDQLATSFKYAEMVINVVRGPYRGREFHFTTDRVSVGKASQNDIPLPDETVSRLHAEILRDAKGYLLRDLGSTNGTFLDGSEIREAFLRNGSQVSVGETRFRFRVVQRKVEAEPFEPTEFEGLLGATAAMRGVFALAQAVAPLDLTVVIQGEPGTGRRSLARAIVRRSALQDAPVTQVDCAEESPARVERLLFHPRTGALAPGSPTPSAGASGGAAPGFDADASHGHGASTGTLILVEPWEIAPGQQGRLAEAIRNRRNPSALDPAALAPRGQRFLAVTSRDLAGEVARERFDPELHALLDRVRIEMPPLRDRIADLPDLVALFARALDESGIPVSDAVVRVLGTVGQRLSWPGNLTTLQDTLRALATVGDRAAPPDLEGVAATDLLRFGPDQSFGEHKARWIDAFEKQYLSWLMSEHRGNVSRAARTADMDRKHLHRLLKRHGLR
jgi:DNA-binding NtrC family response regulator